MRWEVHTNILVGNTKGMIQFGRSKRRWGDNIKVDLKDIQRDGTDWTQTFI